MDDKIIKIKKNLTAYDFDFIPGIVIGSILDYFNNHIKNFLGKTVNYRDIYISRSSGKEFKFYIVKHGDGDYYIHESAILKSREIILDFGD